MLRFFKVFVSFWFRKLSSIKGVMKNHFWIKCGIDVIWEEMGRCYYYQHYNIIFPRSSIVAFIVFCCCLFLPLKKLFGINDSSFAEFTSFSCKNNEFFLFYLMLFRKRPRNQQKINTHSYASLVSIHHCAVFVMSLRRLFFSVCNQCCAFQFDKLNTF